MVGEVIKRDLRLHMARDALELTVWVMNEDVVNEDAVCLVCPSGACVIFRREQVEVPREHLDFGRVRRGVKVPREPTNES
jgi:hypothetical protein